MPTDDFTFTVTGRVFNNKNAPLAGASVTLTSQSLSAVTDAQGRYTLSGVKVPASRELLIATTKAGFAPDSFVQKLRSKTTVRVNFSLRPSA